MPDLTISDAAPGDPRLKRMIRAHKDYAAAHTPPGSGHALNPGDIDPEAYSYWIATLDGAPAGCVALHRIDATHAEIKTMHTLEPYRRHGVARALLAHVEEEAKRRAITRLSLETGKGDGFASSRRLYEACGFQRCEPFGAYASDPFSFCMTKTI